MQRKRLPATVDNAVWREMTKEQARIRSDREVEKVQKEFEGNQDEIVSAVEGAGHKAKDRAMIEARRKETIRRKVDEEEHQKMPGGLGGGRDEKKKWSNERSPKIETVTPVGGPRSGGKRRRK